MGRYIFNKYRTLKLNKNT